MTILRNRQVLAALISAVGHVCLFAVLLLVRLGEGPPAQRSVLINAELVTLRPPEIPPAVGIEPDAPVSPLAPPPQPVTPVAPEPRVEPVPAPVVVDNPPIAEPEVETPQDEPPAPAAEDAAPPIEQAVAAEESEPITDPTAADAGLEPAAPPTVEPEPEKRSDQVLRRRLASWTGRFTEKEPEPNVTWREGGQAYTAVLRRVAALDAMGMERLLVTVTTERDGQPYATELTMTRMAFSNFAQFIDRWDPNVGLHDDVIDGRFHSNTEILVHREGGVHPTFNGKVTLAAHDVRTEGPGYLNQRKLFPAGLETNVRRIGLPKRDTAFAPGALPPEHVHRFERDAAIVFDGDGSFGWESHDGEGGRETHSLGDEPFYLVAADDVTLSVRGIVNGKVLVYSPKTIVIVDDLTYADDPRSEGANDYLGLVSESTVEIAEPEVTGAGDLTIHASIYARNRFAVRNFMSRASGTLAIVGSVTAGSVSATEPRYATNIAFDERLTTLRAPGFPLSDRYELDEWKGEWRPVSQ